GMALEPAAEDHLLLVPARQRPDRLSRVVPRSDRQRVVPAAVRNRLDPAADEEAKLREPAPRRRAEVLGDRPHHERALSLTAGRKQADAGGDRTRGIPQLPLLAVELEAAGVQAADSEGGLRDFRRPRSDLPVERDDLPGEDLEVDVAESGLA